MKPHPERITLGTEAPTFTGTLFGAGHRGAPRPALIFVHGWGGSEAQYRERAAHLAELGCLCLTFDLRGHGATSALHETVSRADHLRDVLGVYDLLAARADVDPARIGVVGSSYGGYLAAILTSLRAVRWLSLRAPALYKDPEFERPKRQLHLDPDLPAYRHRVVRPRDNIALWSCAAFRGDVLVVESEHDKVVPHPVIANYLTALAHARTCRHVLLGHADHGLSTEAWRQEYTEVLMAWFSARLAEVAAAPPATGPGIHPRLGPRAQS